MKKQLIILTSLLVGVGIAISAVVYFLSFHAITLSLAAPDMGGTVYRYSEGEAPRKVTAVTATQAVKLQDGNYGYSADNTKYDSAPIRFTVAGKEASVTIDPAYSRQQLATLLEDQQAQITTVITNTYGKLLGDYDIHTGFLYQKGEWYGATIAEHMTPDGNSGDTYRIVLHKENNEWTIAAAPTLVLTTHDNPTIPKDVITEVNNL